MKRLFPDFPDVSPDVANRAVRIIERYLKTHRVNRARDLPEEAKVRLYRDLRLFFDGDQQSPQTGQGKSRFSIGRLLSSLWEKIEDFFSSFCRSGDYESVVLVFRLSVTSTGGW
ncbi:MAG: hypothetical protein N3B12_00765 [Armatimonadetes bacterium]|nr:hypothetical protein [Armatimonadota bacterium]